MKVSVKNDCKIYIVFGSKMLIPVNPEEIEISRPTDHDEYDVLGIGQIVVPKRPSLKEISWSSFFPSGNDPYINTGTKSPKYYVDRLERAMKQRQKGRVIISRSGLFDTNMRCVIEEFTTTDKGGEPDDIYYDLKLVEYRDYAPQVVSIITQPQTAEQTVEVAATEERPVETPVMRVGATVIANGVYCNDSYGSKPHGTANNLQTTVTRIVATNPYPIHIGHYGWLQESQLQIIG